MSCFCNSSASSPRQRREIVNYCHVQSHYSSCHSHAHLQQNLWITTKWWRGCSTRRQNKGSAKSPPLLHRRVLLWKSARRARISGAFTVSANSHLTAFTPAAAAVIAAHRPELETIIIMESQGFSKRCKIISWRASGLWLRSLKY